MVSYGALLMLQGIWVAFGLTALLITRIANTLKEALTVMWSDVTVATVITPATIP